MVRQQEKIENGFTLIELLVAMAAFVIVVAIIADIFSIGLGGTRRAFGSQAAQESGRFIMESMAKEIRMSRIIRLDGFDYTDNLNILDNAFSGPYASLEIENGNGENVTYSFNNGAKQISRQGSILTSSNVETTGGFYVFKNSASQPRVTVALRVNNKTSKPSNLVNINLQTTVSSRTYAP